MRLDQEDLDGVIARAYPTASAAGRDWYGPALLGGLRDSSLWGSVLRVAHFLGQVGHETGQLRYRGEIWGPTKAQRRYEGRRDLGNIQPGDGYRFRGRGPFQLTGRANYCACGKALRLPLEQDPDLVTRDPVVAVKTALWYWEAARPRLSALADRDDLSAVTRQINGGQNGLYDRRICTDRAKQALAWAEGMAIQRRLVRHGAEIAIDGIVGEKTRAAIADFQRAQSIHETGVVDAETWSALESS
jgi:putative chitinase